MDSNGEHNMNNMESELQSSGMNAKVNGMRELVKMIVDVSFDSRM